MSKSPAVQSKGWGIATLVVILAIAVNSWVAWFHYTKSSRLPTDLSYKAAGDVAR